MDKPKRSMSLRKVGTSKDNHFIEYYLDQDSVVWERQYEGSARTAKYVIVGSMVEFKELGGISVE